MHIIMWTDLIQNLQTENNTRQVHLQQPKSNVRIRNQFEQSIRIYNTLCSLSLSNTTHHPPLDAIPLPPYLHAQTPAAKVELIAPNRISEYTTYASA